LQLIKVASPIQAVLNTLNKAKEIYFPQGIDLQVIKMFRRREANFGSSDAALSGRWRYDSTTRAHPLLWFGSSAKRRSVVLRVL
ncbi:MAG: hypothetical protein Q8736_02805, partial [Sweet potato little leaf phytoplasma]|nr:hypothetical protein [Sweet potato little leaf phytoplasma]